VAPGELLQLKKVDLLPADKAKFEIPNTTAFGWKSLHPRSQANTLHQLFKEYQSSLIIKAKSQGHKVVLFVLNFMDLIQDHELFEQQVIQLGNYVVTKYLVDWLYYWQAPGKHKYVRVTLKAIKHFLDTPKLAVNLPSFWNATCLRIQLPYPLLILFPIFVFQCLKVVDMVGDEMFIGLGSTWIIDM
jgi:hypothetical protein